MQQRLKKPYQGYFKNHDMREDPEITQVGPGMPGGEYLRRAWQQAALSEEVTDLPVLVEILGEELVLSRTTKGVVGLVDKHCSHRGSSLEYGIATDEGIRCCYHGWHYAPDGKGDASAVDKDKMDAIGQIEDRDRESQQREPGDFEAITSQGRIAIHERENWVSTDRGIGMMRRLVRDGVRAVRNGTAYTSLPRSPKGAVGTFTQDSVITRAPIEGLDDDELIREYGKRYAQMVIDSADVHPGERKAYLQAQLDTLHITEL